MMTSQRPPKTSANAGAAATETAPEADAPAAAPPSPPQQQPNNLPAVGIVCPFCAHVRPNTGESATPCPKCTMTDTPSTRRSTGERIGPWFVLQRKNPTAPGLRFSVLLTLARRGHVTARSIVRGPTTGQLWQYASQVKGLSRIFGICWHCAGSVSPDALTCPRCRSAQEIPDDPDTFLEGYDSLPLMREVPLASAQIADADRVAIDETPAFSSQKIAPPRTPTHPPIGPPPKAIDPAVAPTVNVPTERPAPPTTSSERAIVPTLAPAGSPAPANRQSAAAARAARRGLPTSTALGKPLIPPGVRGGAGQSIMSATELAAVFQLEAGGVQPMLPPPPPSFTRRVGRFAWRTTKVGLVAVIVLGIAGAAVAYLRPDWADQARTKAQPYLDQASAWGNQWLNRIGGGGTGADATVKIPDASLVPLDNGSAAPPTTPIRPSNETNATITPSKPDTKLPPAVTTDNSARPTPQTKTDPPKPAVGQPTVVAVSPKPSQPVTPTPHDEKPPAETKPPEVKPPTPAPTAPPVNATKAAELSLDEAIEQATALRNSALDAEGRKDWRAAVLIYQQIEKLPQDAWPSDLKVKLELARERMGS